MVATVLPTKPKVVDQIPPFDEKQDPECVGRNRSGGCCKRNLCWPSVKLLIFLVLLAFFSLILAEEIMGLQYDLENHESEVKMSFRRPKNVTFPAVTICNNNPIQKSKFCRKYPEACSSSSDDQDPVVNLSSFHRLTSKMSPRDWIPLGQTWQEFTKYCHRVHNTGDGNIECKHVTKVYWSLSHQNCFTFLSGEDKLIGDYRKGAFWTFLDFHPEENIVNDTIVGGQLFIHDPDNRIPVGFPVSSYTLKPGKMYSYRVKQTNYQRLPPPYDSGCRYYDDESVPSSQEECYNKCLYDKFMFSCGCMPDEIPFFDIWHSTSYCKSDNASKTCLKRERSAIEEVCNDLCPIKCTESTYCVKVDEIDIPVHNSDVKDARRRQAIVLMKFDTNEQKNYYETPLMTEWRMCFGLLYLYCGAVLQLLFLVIGTIVQMCRICRSDSKKD